jgi:hypothetical protein
VRDHVIERGGGMMPATRKVWCWRVLVSVRLGGERLIRYGISRRARRSEGLCVRPNWWVPGLASVIRVPAWLAGEWYGKVSRQTISEMVGTVDGANFSWRCCWSIS